jgi:hypothetical protein
MIAVVNRGDEAIHSDIAHSKSNGKSVNNYANF